MTSRPDWWLRGFALIFLALPGLLSAQPLSRSEALRIAETFVQHEWTSSSGNVRHGLDANSIEVHTPDRNGGHGSPSDDCWVPDASNIGVAYKWGGFDTPESFDAGVRAGKAAGDVYTGLKRKKGGAAVSGSAVGIDCSGFISRCWKLPRKHSTSMLINICDRLPSPADLEPADIMNFGEGHVLLFVRWMDSEKSRALFYEAAPFSKTRAAERDIATMVQDGYRAMRYRGLRN